MLKKVDKTFLTLTILLIATGLFIFLSASLGVLAKDESKFVSIVIKQLVLGLGAGCILGYIVLRAPISFWKHNAVYFLITSAVLCILVFIPNIGFEHAGARRWVSLGPISFQPAEFLKVAMIFFAAGWFSVLKRNIALPKKSLYPIISMIAFSGILLLRQPDTKSFILIVICILSIAYVAGIQLKHIGIVVLIGLVLMTILVFTRPYVMERVQTFLHPTHDTHDSSWQSQQSKIAIGSGKLLGRGLGQSVQKFSYLPEPQGDSIFAVVGEEFGFVGSMVLILLFVGFILRGYHIASRTKDNFSRYTVIGIITLIGTQSFMNIASIVGVFPLTGVPLVFVSHGGTSLMLSIGMAAMVLHISKNMLPVRI
ncbi:MAG: cell division protein FtsW [Candidatus Pacebacteria bacterium]|nr:cell division protein FtsW [Candidatus Paceibacterota bacterium]